MKRRTATAEAEEAFSAPKRRFCSKASLNGPLEQLHARAQDLLETARAQRTATSRAAQERQHEEEAERRELEAVQARHAEAQERRRAAQASLEEARKALEAAHAEALRREHANQLAEKQEQEAKQQLDADLLTSGVRRSAAEDAQRQRSVQENIMIFKLKSLFSQLNLPSHGKQGLDSFLDTLEHFLAAAGYSRPAPRPVEVAPEASSAAQEDLGVTQAVPPPDLEVPQASASSKSPAEAPEATGANLILVMEGGGFRVESTFPTETAEVRQQELRTAISAAKEAVVQRGKEHKTAQEAHLGFLREMEAKEEASRKLLQELEQLVVKAKQSQEACAVEVTKLQELTNHFETCRENPEKAKPKAVKALKVALKELGAEEQTLKSLPEILAKKKGKRTTKERKLLGGLEEILKAQLNARRGLHNKCTKEVDVRQDQLRGAEVEARSRSEAIEASKLRVEEQKALVTTAEEQVQAALSALNEHEGKMTSVGKMLRFNSWSEACCICCEEMPRDAAATLGCGHGWYCPACVNRFVEARLDEGLAGVPCPSCHGEISEGDLIRLLPKPTIFRLHASNIHRKAMASGAKPRPCPTADCGMQKIFEDARSARDTCPLCEKESCWWCGAQPFHENMTCEQWRDVRRRSSTRDGEDASFLKWMKETGTKQCPTCGMATSKENLEMQSDQVEECHKMLCRSCGTKFCFACLAILTDSYTCGCTQNAHNFVDPHTGKLVKHLKKPKAKAKRCARDHGRLSHSGVGGEL
ncbi:unnamed protein product [Durusdinium trenchii]|uniref:RBR-type E3 ubiquitin transferase n=1 Tax=Durusdinium trenchii TaxID=1381693 RepID=A0ABP0M4Y9_9DINO